jgi:hypothetical protein
MQHLEGSGRTVLYIGRKVLKVNGKADYIKPWSSWAFPEQVGLSTEPLTYPGLLGTGAKGTIILSNHLSVDTA